ncbi:MAG: hypothetical protein K0M45_00360 [Candidatus Paracaedibacteraceae bacterium]|nr:hypothetical protein [Candidatus Paracaedibacteraceae bacterium]
MIQLLGNVIQVLVILIIIYFGVVLKAVKDNLPEKNNYNNEYMQSNKLVNNDDADLNVRIDCMQEHINDIDANLQYCLAQVETLKKEKMNEKE